MRVVIAYSFLLAIFAGCSSKQATQPPPKKEEPAVVEILKEEEEETPAEREEEIDAIAPLVFNVSLGINPMKKNWVLYKNGTYMLYKDALDDELLVKASAKRLDAITTTSNVAIQKSNLAKGWIASFGNTGIYTYVSHEDVDAGIPSDEEIKRVAIASLALDQKEKEVIHISTDTH